MTDNICPICKRPNDANAERCWYCQADLSQNQQPTPVNGTDWLNGFREESTQSPEPEMPEPDQKIETPEEVPDWLVRIRTREQMEREAQASQNPETEAEPVVEEKKEEIPDWLKEIKAGYSGKKADAEQEESIQESSSPFTPSPLAESESLSMDQDQSDDTSEWLSRLAAWKPTDEETTPSTEEPVQDGPVVTGSGESESLTENLPEAQFNLDSLTALHQAEFRPYELNRDQGWQTLEPEDPKVDPQVDPQDEQQLSFEDFQPDEEVLPPSNFDLNAMRETILVQHSNPDYFVEKNSGDGELENEDFQDFDLPTEPEPEPEPDPVSPSIEDLVFTGEQSASGVDNSNAIPFMPDDLPDWLASAKLETNKEKIGETEFSELDNDGLDAELEKADLPSWLESARISESSASSVDSTLTANLDEEGLFAGIPGTLQTPNFNVDIRKPVGYGTGLKVSERQKKSANLFASMMEETLEDEAIEPLKKPQNFRIIWRLLLAVAFIGVIFLSKNLLNPYVVEPALFPPEVVSLYDQINNISVDKPVLLAGDFEAAVTGELSWSSRSLLENLMRRNIQLVILASTPTGSTLMNQLIENASKNVEGYDVSQRVITLGYLPGGSTGIQLLAANPRSAMPFTHDLDAAWNSEILHDVNAMSDFGALIVMSDKSESSRIWIEQVQPGLENTPLMFVVSAQAAPLLQPYFQSGQISGYVAGFYGSLAYKQMFQQTTGVDDQLSGFQSAMLLAFVIIFVGGLVTMIRPAAPEHKG